MTVSRIFPCTSLFWMQNAVIAAEKLRTAYRRETRGMDRKHAVTARSESRPSSRGWMWDRYALWKSVLVSCGRESVVKTERLHTASSWLAFTLVRCCHTWCTPVRTLMREHIIEARDAFRWRFVISLGECKLQMNNPRLSATLTHRNREKCNIGTVCIFIR